MATSFISEHSAELSIVPRLKLELEKHYNFVTPLFPWFKRETSNISMQVHHNDEFKILALFPRRPKLENGESNKVFITINKDLLGFKELASTFNVPVIAGCPVSTNFWELSKCKNYILVEINEKTTSDYLYQVTNKRDKKAKKGLSISRLVKMIDKSSTFNIEKFQDLLLELRSAIPGAYFFGPRYKPTYFLIKYR